MTCGYKEKELLDFLGWYHSQSAIHKIMIAGNHDRYIEDNRGLFQELLRKYPSIQYLEDSGTMINNLSIWGTPHSKHFCRWAFNKSDEEMDKLFSCIPFDVDILVSHAPQFGVLDRLGRGEMVGEKSLSNQFPRFTQIQVHISGHIHSAYGKDTANHTALNVSVVNEAYELQNKPITFKIYPHG